MQKAELKHDCEHIIGLLHHTDYSALVGLDDLRSHIQSRNEFNNMLRADPCFAELTHFLRPEWTMEHYADLRRNTNLTRFNCCPTCGAKIDWKALKQM